LQCLSPRSELPLESGLLLPSSPMSPTPWEVMKPGATHTINVGEIALPEVLVSYVANDTSGSGIWTWNGSLPEPVTAMGVQLSNYSTVLQIYDPDYTTTGTIGNTTFINLFSILLSPVLDLLLVQPRTLQPRRRSIVPLPALPQTARMDRLRNRSKNNLELPIQTVESLSHLSLRVRTA